MSRRFRIGTFNLFNLVSPNVHYYGKREYSQKRFKQKTDWIGNQLQNMYADIVGFQEIFHEEPLKQILAQSDKYKHYELHCANANGKGPVVGLATRFPVLNVEVIKDFPLAISLIDEEDQTTEIPLQINKFSRAILKADVQVSTDLTITVFVTHLKSKRPLFGQHSDRNDFSQKALGELRSMLKRSTEACALRNLLVDHVQNSPNPAIVLGDLNDGGRSVSTSLIMGSKPWMYKPTDANNEEWQELKQKTWQALFHNCKDIQARQSYHDMYYTHIHNGHYECLDHIIVGNQFANENRNKLGRVINVEAYNDHLIDETLSEESVPVWQSDHGQLVATIELMRQ